MSDLKKIWETLKIDVRSQKNEQNRCPISLQKTQWTIASNKKQVNERPEKKGRKIDVRSQKNNNSERPFSKNGKS